MTAKRVLFLLLLAAMLVACGNSPRERAKDFREQLPAEVGDWERSDRDTVELHTSTVTSEGHVLLVYEGDNDAIAYIEIRGHSSEEAAELADAERERDLLLDGIALETNAPPRQVSAKVAQTDRVWYALFQEDTITVEIDAIAAEGEDPISEEAFNDLLTIVRNAYARVIED
jgi:uncharacterized Zn finger protein